MQKRILSFILCAVLICGLFPTTATAMGSQAEYTGVCTHGSHEGYIELTSEYLATHNDRLSSGKYYLSGDLNYSGSYYLDVAPNANVELCLNGHTLTFSNQYLLVLDDASLLLENGKVKLESSANKVIWGYNSEAVEIRNCDIDGNGTATYLVFINGDTGAQEVKITDSKLHNMTFEDVGAGMYYAEAIRWAASEGIVGGYTATQFGPDDAITREQLAAILWRYAQHKKYDVSVGEDTNILSYADALTVSEWAVPAMQWANGVGLIQGSDNNLMPKGNATRAQAAAILHRFCETVTGE